MKKYLIILLVLVFSCNKPIEPNTINFSTGRGVPIIHTTINGKGASLLIDTGATQSIIDLSVQDDYKFKVSAADDTIEGIGGNNTTYYVKDVSIKYNDSILDVDFRASNIKNIRNKLGVVGIIGTDYLSKNNLIINFNDKTITRK